MSNSQPSKELQMLDMKLFNASTHHYTLKVWSTGKVETTADKDSAMFNCTYAYVMASPQFGDDKEEVINQLGCYGNQHPDAAIRDMAKVRKWDEQTLREYSMFTIGDFLIVTNRRIFFAVNGDLVIREIGEGFETTKGKA